MSSSVQPELEPLTKELLKLFGAHFLKLVGGKMPGQYPEWFEEFKDQVSRCLLYTSDAADDM
jgi:hypothetical protein